MMRYQVRGLASAAMATTVLANKTRAIVTINNILKRVLVVTVKCCSEEVEEQVRRCSDVEFTVESGA